MSMHPVSRKYSLALYEVGMEAAILEQLVSEVEALSKALDTDLEGFLVSPKIPVSSRLAVIREVFEGTSLQFIAFIEFVINKGRAALLSEIATEFALIHEQNQGIQRGVLDSAVELDSETVEQIQQQVSKYFGQEVRLKARLRPEILGGIKVHVGSRLFDASIKSRLDSLRLHMKAGQV
jgi:F-type H+-transporting ATPase subunit delta